MKSKSPIDRMISECLDLGKPRIGFGLRLLNDDLLRNLIRCQKYAQIVLFGPATISGAKGFEVVIDDEPEKILARHLFEGRIEGAIRGTLDSLLIRETYAALAGRDPEKDAELHALMENAHGCHFFLSTISNPTGWRIEDKIFSCEALSQFLKTQLKVKPKVGCLTGLTKESYIRKKEIRDGMQGELNQNFEDAEVVVAHLNAKGIEAKNYNIEIESAIKDGCNIIVPPNGMAGSLIFRTLALLGGGKMLACPAIGFPQPFENNTKNETDFLGHIRWLVSWINSRKRKTGK
jgi:predicted methyltransferase MtxX (methanogen marker protein 4)